MSLYSRVQAAADRMEDRIAAIPGLGWFHFNTTGHPISWLQHTLIAVSITGYGTMLGLALGDPLMRPRAARIAFWSYVARELYGFWGNWRELGFMPAAFVDRVDRTPRPENGFVVQAGLYVGWFIDGLLDVVGPWLWMTYAG